MDLNHQCILCHWFTVSSLQPFAYSPKKETDDNTTRIVALPPAKKGKLSWSFRCTLLINASNSGRFLAVHQKLEFCISSRVCVSVQSRLANLTGSYHATQVFHTSSCQLNYIRMLDENNGSHLMVVKHQLKLNFIY